MSAGQHSGGPDAHQVIDFLRANPAFLDQHPQVLSQLSIPHQSGDAISLLERQVAVLREDNGRFKRQLENLMHHARQNGELTRKVHALVLRLMNAVGPQAVFTSLEQCLVSDFGAEQVRCVIFADTSAIDAAALPQFVGRSSALRAAFAAVVASGQARCGALAPAQSEALFAAAAFSGSAAIMPLVGRQWDGIVVTASADTERYREDMGTEFLHYLRDVLALVIEPWVKHAP
jgi:uncharacterized protein YigA (DUF484 family)